jgi:hypothetical protein
MKSSRRQFIIYSAAGAASLAMGGQANAQATLTEADPQAAALGYKVDAATVDKAKFAKFQDGQNCANCTLYTSKSADAGTCNIFAGKMVSAKGWCNAWVKKA